MMQQNINMQAHFDRSNKVLCINEDKENYRQDKNKIQKTNYSTMESNIDMNFGDNRSKCVTN